MFFAYQSHADLFYLINIFFLSTVLFQQPFFLNFNHRNNFCFNVIFKKSSQKFSFKNSVIVWCNVMRKIFWSNYNDGFCHVLNCYLEDGVTIF